MTSIQPKGTHIRLSELGITLPEPPPPAGVYAPLTIVGNLGFLSGHAAQSPDGELITGVIGRDLGVQAARNAVRLTTLRCLASLRAALGDLDRIERVAKVLGMLRATSDFKDHPLVMDACTSLLIDVFGPHTTPARSAVGMGSLPGGTCVEIEMVVVLRTSE